ncbi:hypothetical protein BKI52_19215 [marine bacterium AO1-C]|nr:hypothetical protein BKI52_19215 [marine bacterium AO1-C]
MPVDFFVGLGAASSIVTLAQTRKQITSKTEMYLNYLKKGKRKIAILGAGGVGKTSISLLLSGNKDEISFEYDESINTEKLKLGNNTIGNFIIGPGQARRVESYWPNIQRDIVQGSIVGIINVVAYGYHSIGIDLDKVSYYNTSMTNEDFITEHTQKRRKIEIELLDYVKSSLIHSKGKIRMLTIVNKQDLWWSENTNNEVENFYKKGNYNEMIKEIESQKGKTHFLHEYVSMSSVINNFVVKDKIIKYNTQGYDQRLQLANNLNVTKALEGLTKN